MNIKLFGDKVLVEVEEGETKTNSGLIVARTSGQGDVKTGTIVAVGGGKRNDKGEILSMSCKAGDRIMFNYGTPVLVEGKQYLLVSESDEVILKFE